MAPRGPRTKPTKLKVLAGTARKHRLNPNEPRPEVARPDVPDHLTDAARQEWDRVVVKVVDLGLMSDLDRAALAAYCQAYGRWVAAERALARVAAKDALTEGLMLRTKTGNAIQNPLVGAANKAMADMVRYASEFGLTPSARTRVSADAVVDDNDPFAIFDSPRASR
ncbi:phage terminase small subunit P27 family [Fluviibacterium sp. DFM31]|uniref:Phage terminase small subunit P27 family n=1 Tax=Meridianimarinicoccus marinus TaxID=3231483 RepID=A0ABV3L514_9RHOB